MTKRSFVYRNIFIYRAVMNFLYMGAYPKRFEPVVAEIKKLPTGRKVLELCFGDTYIADFCKRHGYPWIGLDINEHFVNHAQKAGFDARTSDLTQELELPKSAVCVIIGSLYHFNSKIEDILKKMFQAANVVIISEPVQNFSANTGVIGWFARRGANAGKGHEPFRFDRGSFRSMLETNSKKLGFRIDEVGDYGKDFVVKLTKNENDSDQYRNPRL